MKKIISIACFVLISLTFFHFDASAKLILKFGTKSHPDTANGCWGDKGICLVVKVGRAELTKRSDLGDDMGIAEISLASDGKLRFDILIDNAENNKGPYFLVLKDLSLDLEIARQLGLRSLTIKAGKYRVDYSKYENGSVILDLKE